MDLPIQLKFFKKLELYQELRKRDRDRYREWMHERNILAWAANRAHHKDLRTPLVKKMVRDHKEIMGPVPADIDDPEQYIQNRLNNLVVLGYAEDSGGGITFTSDGFLTGEITNELRDNPGSGTRYAAAYYLSWFLFYAAVFLVFAEVVNVLGGWLGKLIHISCIPSFSSSFLAGP